MKKKGKPITVTKIKTKKELIEIFNNNFEKFKNDIEKLFLNDYLTINLLLNIYNNITEDKAYEIREKKQEKEKIKNKILSIFKIINKENFINKILEYKESLNELNDENSYFYNKIWYAIFNYGKEKEMFEYPKEVDDFFKKYNLIEELKKQLNIDEMNKLYQEKIKKIEILDNYEEFVSITQRTNISKIIYILKFYVNKQVLSIELINFNSFKL